MKKLYIPIIIGGALCTDAFGLSMDLECGFLCDVRYGSTTAACKNICNNCMGISDSTTSGAITTITTKTLNVKCPSVDGGVADCSCDNVISYQCAKGYYGTATSASSGCTKCPANATCGGGNGSGFICDKGYYKNGAICARCPSSGGVYGTTADAGATSITSCYLSSGTTFSDNTGSGTYTSDCYYSN